MRKWLSYPLGICWRGAGVALLSLLSAQSWQDVAGGTNFPVEVLFPWQGSLYVGGRFTAVGGSSLQANGIARYSSAGWSALGNPQGVSGTGHVYALTVYQGKLIVGGDFSGAGGGSAQNLAAYDPATNTWSAVGGGVNGSVTALAVYDGELLVGGNFTRVGVGTASPQNIAFFARWNGSQWLAPDPSNPSYLLTGGAPLAFVEFQNKLYLAGNFTAAYYNETDKAYLAVWNKAAQRVEAAYPPGQGPDNNIWAAVVWNGALYLGGDFSTFGGASGKLVRFDGVQATGVPGAPTSGSVRALLPVGSTLYVAGSFTTVGGQTVNRIAALSSAGTWSGLGSGLGPTLVRTLALYNNYLYAGGGFTADGSGAGLSYLARFSSATPLVSQKAPSLFVVEVAPRAYALWAETPLLCHRLRLINAVGQTLYEEEGRLLQGEYLLPLLPAEGLYFLQVEGAGGEVYTYRFSTL